MTGHKIPSRQEQRRNMIGAQNLLSPVNLGAQSLGVGSVAFGPVGGPFQEALMRERSRGINGFTRQVRSSERETLTDEQRLIID